MVKDLNKAKSIIRENERLEEMYRTIMTEKKTRKKNLEDHKNKLVDLYSILVKKSSKNLNLTRMLFRKMSELIKRVFLSQKYSYLNLPKIMEIIHHFIGIHSER
jgi:hypothetical protein